MSRIILILALSLVLFPTATHAQIDVTATGGTPDSSYVTLKEAFDAINAGVHMDSIAIAVSGNTVETASAVLYGSGGTSSYARVTIQPSGGATRTITGNITGPLVDLNGADQVTIDGVNAGGDALVLENTNTNGGYGYSTGPSTIRFINDATGNMVRNAIINGSCGVTPASQTATIYFGGKTSGAPENVTGNDNNMVTNCDLGPAGGNLPATAIWALGNTSSTARANSGIIISDNRIHDHFYAGGGSVGIYVSSGNTEWTISGNSIFQTEARTQTGGSSLRHWGIYLSSNSGSGFEIVDNFIGGSEVAAGGAPWSVTGARTIGFTGIYLSVGGASVQNNTVTNFLWQTNGDWFGIQTARGTLDLGTVAGNTIGAATGTDAVVLTTGLTGKLAVGIDAASSAGSITIANNVIGAIRTAGTSATISTTLIGIRTAANVVTVRDNLIGSETTSASLQASNPSTSSTAQEVTGIRSSSTNIEISGNTVANLHNAYAGTGAAGRVLGIAVTAGTNTIRANVVRNLSNDGASTGSGATAAIQGISLASTSGAQTVAENLVHSLSGAAASAASHAVGIYYGGPTTGTHLVARNVVHSLALATSSTSASLTGIQAGAGVATYQNNMVRLGVNSAGDPITSAIAMTGILKATTAAGRFYFNSIHIGGVGVDATANNTFAFRRTSTGSDELRNNIFSNARQNASTGGRHFAMVLNAPTTVISDHNLYSVAPGNAEIWSLDGGTTSIATLQALRLSAGYNQDAHSGLGQPNFAAPDDPAATMSLALASPSPAEGTGFDIPTVTDDWEGETRAVLTPVDIGADAGDYLFDASTDVFSPSIDYTPLVNTSSTGDRVLTAHLTDVAPADGGIPDSGAWRPRIWYKKSTDASWVLSSPGELVSGTGRDGIWDFTIIAADLMPTLGDVIEYYVVAQDQASTPNLWYNPVAADNPIHSDVATQTVPPAAPYSYEITGSLAGTYYVPNPQPGRQADVFPSLTADGGFFEAVNSMPLSGDVVVIINGDVTVEDGANVLGQWLEDGAGGWTLTIRPDSAVTRVLSGTTVAAGAPMIPIFGADRVVIDGRVDGAGRHLVLRNTNAAPASTGPAIQFDQGSQDCVVRNCILESNGTSATLGTLQFGTSGANTAILIAENDIRNAIDGTAGSPANAVYGNAAGNSGLIFLQNEIRNWTNAGILFTSAGGNLAVQDNNFYWDLVSTPSTAQTAVLVGGTGDGHLISGNWIGGQAPQCGGAPWENAGSFAFTGISLTASGTTNVSQVQGNTIGNIRMTGAGAAAFTGINTAAGAVAVGTTVGNTVGSAVPSGIIEIAGASSGLIRGLVIGSSVAAQVSNNLVANVQISNASATAAFRGIELSLGSSAVSSIQSNTVQSITMAGTGAFAGIYATAGQLDLGSESGNLVGHLAEANSIQFAGSAASYGIYLVSTAGGQAVAQNTVANVLGTGNAAFYAIHVGVPWNSLASTISENTVQWITLSNAGTSASFRGISLVGAGTNPSYGAGRATVTGNLVGHDSEENAILVAGGGVAAGIFVYGYDSNPIEISNNRTANLTATGGGAGVSLQGIFHDRGIGTIANNEVHDLVSASTSVNETLTAAVSGIYADLGSISLVYTDNFLDGNIVHALRSVPAGAAATVVCGITGGGGSTYARGVGRSNRVYDLTNSSASTTAAIRGIYHYLGNWTFANNQVALSNSPNVNAVGIAGVYLASGGYYYYNSIAIGGSQENGAASSYAFVRPANAAPTLRNNIFYNERANGAGGSGGHYAIGNLYMSWSLWGANASDYNVLIAPDSAAIGRFSSTDLDFAGWQTESGGDGHSLSETAAVIASSALFVNAATGDLNILPTTGYDAPPIVSNVGIALDGQTTDFGGVDERWIFPDIGADEIRVDRILVAPGDLKPASPSYPGNYDDVTVDTGGEPVLTGPVNVFDLLTLGGGNVNTDVFTMTIQSTGNTSRTSGHVEGNLRKHVAAGSGIQKSFEIGTGSDFTPVDIEFGAVATEGFLLATTVSSDHPQLAFSEIDPDESANRFWTLTNEGVAFDMADALFHFVPADLDSNANPLAFIVQKYDDPDWSSPGAGLVTETSCEATGLTSLSDFAVGETVGFDIVASAGPGGTIEPSGTIDVAPGGEQGFIITADACYTIAEVLVDGIPVGPVGSYTFVDVQADHTIEALFDILTYTLTTAVVGGGSLTVVPDSTLFDCGSQAEITAHPDSGWAFDHWTGSATGNDNPLVLIMDEDKNVTGVFVDIQVPDITLMVPNGGEVWEVDSTETITWTATDNVGVTAIDLVYSLDGGTTYPHAIAAGLPNTGAYDWTIPNTIGRRARVKAIAHDADGNSSEDASDADFEIYGPGSEVAELLLASGEVLRVYPNPAPCGTTELLFRAPATGAVELCIYDIGGRLVRRLAPQSAFDGLSSATWDGRDTGGSPVSPGIYLVRYQGGATLRSTQRLVVFR